MDLTRDLGGNGFDHVELATRSRSGLYYLQIDLRVRQKTSNKRLERIFTEAERARELRCASRLMDVSQIEFNT